MDRVQELEYEIGHVMHELAVSRDTVRYYERTLHRHQTELSHLKGENDDHYNCGCKFGTLTTYISNCGAERCRFCEHPVTWPYNP